MPHYHPDFAAAPLPASAHIIAALISDGTLKAVKNHPLEALEILERFLHPGPRSAVPSPPFVVRSTKEYKRWPR